MKKHYLGRVFSILSVMVLSASNAEAQGPPKQATGQFLSEALLTVARTYHVSVLAEVAEPMPTGIVLDGRAGATLRQVLEGVRRQCPGYRFEITHGTVIFGNVNLLKDPNNPMNQTLAQYTIPEDLSEFKLTFPGAVRSAQEHQQSVGGLVVGMGLPRELNPSLSKEVVQEVTARAILLKVAGEVGNLYSLLIFPSEHPTRKEMTDGGFFGWEIAGGPGLDSYKTYLHHRPVLPAQ